MNSTDYILGILCFLILTLGSTYAYQINQSLQTSDELVFIDNQTTRPFYIKVNVIGAVKRPGVVALDNNNARVIDAIKATGGLHKHANNSVINFAENIKNATVVSIPFNFEDKVVIITPKKQKKKAKKQTKKLNNNKKAKKKAHKKKAKKNISLKLSSINPNTASKIQLMLLPGIGETIAGRIIEYRNITKFKTAQDLKKVKGIGKKKSAQIAPYLIF